MWEGEQALCKGHVYDIGGTGKRLGYRWKTSRCWLEHPEVISRQQQV